MGQQWSLGPVLLGAVQLRSKSSPLKQPWEDKGLSFDAAQQELGVRQHNVEGWIDPSAVGIVG